MGTPPGATVVLPPPPTLVTRPAELVVNLVAHRAGGNAMTSPTAAGHRGFRHELLLHRSTAELLEFMLPVVRDGLAAEEPTLLLVRPDTAEAVLRQVGPSPYLTIAPAPTQPGRPAL